MRLAIGGVSAWLADLGWVDAIGPSWLRFVHEAPIPGLQVVQVLFEGGYDADLIPVVLGTQGEVLDVGRQLRLASAAIWKALSTASPVFAETYPPKIIPFASAN